MTVIDAFYYLTAIFVAIGFIYFLVFYRLIVRLNNLPKEEWKVMDTKTDTDDFTQLKKNCINGIKIKSENFFSKQTTKPN